MSHSSLDLQLNAFPSHSGDLLCLSFFYFCCVCLGVSHHGMPHRGGHGQLWNGFSPSMWVLGG